MADQAAPKSEIASEAPLRVVPASHAIDEMWPAVVASVGPARLAVGRWLEAMAADELVVGDVVLAVSEACTNVVVHGYSNGDEGSFRVVAETVGAAIRVTVSDDGGGMVPRPDSPGLGLGVPLIAALTDSLEIRPAAEGRGTVVSMLFTREGAHSRLL